MADIQSGTDIAIGRHVDAKQHFDQGVENRVNQLERMGEDFGLNRRVQRPYR